MKITRHVHACVEIEHEGFRIVIDPGGFGAPHDLVTAQAVLITHRHPDHIDTPALLKAVKKNPDLQVYAPVAVAEELPVDIRVVAHGDTFELGGLKIEVLGAKHAINVRVLPVEENVGYLIDGRILHPGDAFHPRADLELVLLPVNGPWVKMLDIEEWLVAFPPKRFIGIHDGIVNSHGLGINEKILNLLATKVGAEYLPLRPGESLDT
ncbi:metal-dependent hydrolase [Corynebacterium occultum]|uniref:Metal-dependent hydrolase n=1 Tax=Corynebacterium occultum TaxID=2675219 RepID=A0A6B8W373_9CORY|nr:MBL fold metallo-hydrolase [Corynebacterium occultum]QGU06941.1 metal-dependent hydrolase [Corynebacterium occultum]